MIDNVQAIALMMATKDNDMRPTFQSVLFIYDQFKNSDPPSVKDVSEILDKPEASIRSYISKLCKLGMMERSSKGKFRTTSKWVTKKGRILKCNNKLTKLLTK